MLLLLVELVRVPHLLLLVVPGLLVCLHRRGERLLLVQLLVVDLLGEVGLSWDVLVGLGVLLAGRSEEHVPLNLLHRQRPRLGCGHHLGLDLVDRLALAPRRGRRRRRDRLPERREPSSSSRRRKRLGVKRCHDHIEGAGERTSRELMCLEGGGQGVGRKKRS